MIDLSSTLEHALPLVEPFKAQLGSVPCRPRGILLSEFFFFYAAIAHCHPPRIIESGRALGQSTELLARFFPDSRVISIELEETHPDAPKALQRLKPYANVTCLFGDARKLMLEHTRPGDVCIIDGPKDFRALQLAFNTLKHRQPLACFVHDCHQASPTRPFLEKHYPYAFFSDAPAFSRAYWSLNDLFQSAPPDAANSNDDIQAPISPDQAGVLACLAYGPDLPWGRLNLLRRVGRWQENVSRSWRKRRGISDQHPQQA